jgi:hypothetical protein
MSATELRNIIDGLILVQLNHKVLGVHNEKKAINKISCRKIIVNRKTYTNFISYSNKITSSKFEQLHTTPHKARSQKCCSSMDKALRKGRREPKELTE